MSSGSSERKTTYLQILMNTVRAQIPDVLACDALTAWTRTHINEPVPHGWRIMWSRCQVEQAVLRALKQAALLGVSLKTEALREAIITVLLAHEQQIADTALMIWLRGINTVLHRVFLEEVHMMHAQVNVEGCQAIVAEAIRFGWPTHFKEDLTRTDLTILCTPGAPQTFWWGLRSTGTDFFTPDSVNAIEWALARKKRGPAEQRYYHYDGTRLYEQSLDATIVQMVHSLDLERHERMWRDANAACIQAEQSRRRDDEAMQAYQKACKEVQQAETAYQEAVRLKQLWFQQDESED